MREMVDKSAGDIPGVAWGIPQVIPASAVTLSFCSPFSLVGCGKFPESRRVGSE
jgi:hypothetical protein